jgi:hypothetical protein
MGHTETISGQKPAWKKPGKASQWFDHFMSYNAQRSGFRILGSIQVEFQSHFHIPTKEAREDTPTATSQALSEQT